MSIDPLSVVKYPLSSEKCIRLMESDNKLIFVVSLSATKPQIKEAVQTLFHAKVVHVNTQITPRSEKRAIVTFAKETPAIDIATNMGMI